MNKNIKELAGQADFMLCEDGNFYSPTDSQYTPSECYLINAEISKFAELIVKQCITQIALIGISNFENDEHGDIGWTVDTSIEMIKEHFGVTE